MMDNLNYMDGMLRMDRVGISSIVQSVGTPFYCYSADAITFNYTAFAAAFEGLPSTICYALKANSNQAVLTLLARAGAGADVVSEGELRRAIAAGIPAEKIVFSGVGKSPSEIDLALEKGILCFNVESVSELRLINEVAGLRNVDAPVSIRINPDITPNTPARLTTGTSETKFGIAWASAKEVYDYAADLANIRITGIDTHIGSQIIELDAFDAAFSRLTELVYYLRKAGHRIDHVDLGGGLGIFYSATSETDEATLLAAYANIVRKHIKDLDCNLILEPGRFIVGNTGILVTEVLHEKSTAAKNFIIVDAAMNDLVRPSMYEAWHEFVPVRERAPGSPEITADIVGPVCEPGDYLGKSRVVPELKRGDLLALTYAGAYGAVLSGTYNSRRLIPEILVNGDRFDIIRARPSFEALMELDSVPAWLK